MFEISCYIFSIIYLCLFSSKINSVIVSPGHEDLRQDERVMQLFRLVNTLLANDAVTFKRHLR